MQNLREAAARERRAPIFWWLALLAATGAALVLLVHAHYGFGPAAILAVLLATAWAAPLVAIHSLSMPRRARREPPAPGTGSYREWRDQARLLGRLLLYYEDNPDLPAESRQVLRAARADLGDTLRAHPLRDDLERACGRIRAGAGRHLRDWFWREYGPRVRQIAEDCARIAARGDLCDDECIAALRAAVEASAAWMSHSCMPRLLERERLACAVDCAWIAATVSDQIDGGTSAVELAAALVVEWSDFSRPWNPARAVRQVLADRRERSAAAAAAPAAAPPPTEGDVVIRNGKRYRRVRVRRKRRRERPNRGPSLPDVLASFGQWIRYSIRAWTLYR